MDWKNILQLIAGGLALATFFVEASSVILLAVAIILIVVTLIAD